MSDITFKNGEAVWADTGRPVKKTVNYCAGKRLGIEHAKPSQEMDTGRYEYQKLVSFNEVADGMRMDRTELYKLVQGLPMSGDEMFRTDDVARVLNIPPGTLAGKCKAVKK